LKKSDYNRKSKERRAKTNAFTEDIFGADMYAENKTGDSWPVASLYCDHSSASFNEGDPMICEFDSEDETRLSGKEDILSWAASILSISPTARRLVKDASSDGWEIALEDLNGPDFHLDVPEKTIILNRAELSDFALARSTYFSSILIISLVRALRDVWQEKRNGAFDEDYTPESILTLERVRAADLDVIAVMVAWELRCEGHNNLWRHILGS